MTGLFRKPSRWEWGWLAGAVGLFLWWIITDCPLARTLTLLTAAGYFVFRMAAPYMKSNDR